MNPSHQLRTRRKAVAMPMVASRPQGGFVALILALLFAVSWQSFVTQTHNHYDLGFVSASAGQPDELYASKTGKHGPVQLPDDCPVCREGAHAGAVLLPAPIEIAAPLAVAAWVTIASLIALALASRSHDWRSRAPPSPLQA